MHRCRGLSLLSGGLDSQLAIKVLERAGAYVEAVTFVSPFFKDDSSCERFAAKLGVRLRKVDFTDEITALLHSPPHGFGGAMNPCIDCHATMIREAGALMERLGFDFVATGEVVGQRPMSQNRQALGTVERSSGLKGRLVRPLSAALLEPTQVETDGLLDRSLLLGLSGRSREAQIALAREFGIGEYPSPAGGCRLTEEAYGRKVKDLMDHEGLDERWLLELLSTGRRFRLPGGTSVILGRDKVENERLEALSGKGVLLRPNGKPGASALLPSVASPADLALAQELVEAYAKGMPAEGRERFRPFQLI